MSKNYPYDIEGDRLNHPPPNYHAQNNQGVMVNEIDPIANIQTFDQQQPYHQPYYNASS